MVFINRNSEKKNTSGKRRTLLLVLTIVIAIAITLSLSTLYKFIFKPNIKTPDKGCFSLFIPTGADFEAVKDSLYSNEVIINRNSFELTAKIIGYNNIYPGHYLLKDGMNNIQSINMLRKGFQTPVKVVFNNINNLEQLAGRVSDQIEADSLSITTAIRNDSSICPCYFIPNTYEFYWNTDAESFIKKMKAEYEKFWNETRIAKAEEMNLKPEEVSILASIVDKETTKTSEMPRIAGVYLNRLKKHWPLQADPTLIYALGDYSIHRVLDVHKEIDSPYNTYKHAGLPPGPICLPSIAAIDAVLNAERHKYFYFCAKDDLSGYHVFARNINEHNRNAEKYRRALNKHKIYK